MIDWIASWGWDGSIVPMIAMPFNFVLSTALGVRFFGRRSRWIPNAKPFLRKAIAISAPFSAVLTSIELIWCFTFVVPEMLPLCKRIIGSLMGVFIP